MNDYRYYTYIFPTDLILKFAYGGMIPLIYRGKIIQSAIELASEETGVDFIRGRKACREFAIVDRDNRHYRKLEIKSHDDFVRHFRKRYRIESLSKSYYSIHLGGLYMNLAPVVKFVKLADQDEPFLLKEDCSSYFPYRDSYFDFDISDYSSVIGCLCDSVKKECCQECMYFLDRIITAFIEHLIEGFGVTPYDPLRSKKQNENVTIERINPIHIFKVFSGRRGFHVYLIGHIKSALMDHKERKHYFSGAVTFFYNQFEGTKNFISKMCDIIQEFTVDKWNILSKLEIMENIDKKIITEILNPRIQERIESDEIEGKELLTTKKIATKTLKDRLMKLNAKLRLKVVIFLTGVRNDKACTTNVHLLKAPFSIHSDTGLISLPIIPRTRSFDWSKDRYHIDYLTSDGICMYISEFDESLDNLMRYQVKLENNKRMTAYSILWISQNEKILSDISASNLKKRNTLTNFSNTNYCQNLVERKRKNFSDADDIDYEYIGPEQIFHGIDGNSKKGKALIKEMKQKEYDARIIKEMEYGQVKRPRDEEDIQDTDVREENVEYFNTKIYQEPEGDKINEFEQRSENSDSKSVGYFLADG